MSDGPESYRLMRKLGTGITEPPANSPLQEGEADG